MMTGFVPNIYISCQILIQEIRNSTEFPLCNAILRLYWAGSARFNVWGRENPAARILKKGSWGLCSNLVIFEEMTHPCSSECKGFRQEGVFFFLFFSWTIRQDNIYIAVCCVKISSALVRSLFCSVPPISPAVWRLPYSFCSDDNCPAHTGQDCSGQFKKPHRGRATHFGMPHGACKIRK